MIKAIKLRCIESPRQFTVGVEYEVIRESTYNYTITNDSGHPRVVDKEKLNHLAKNDTIPGCEMMGAAGCRPEFAYFEVVKP